MREQSASVGRSVGRSSRRQSQCQPVNHERWKRTVCSDLQSRGGSRWRCFGFQEESRGGRCSSLVKAQWEVTRSCHRRVTCGSRSSLFTLHNTCAIIVHSTSTLTFHRSVCTRFNRLTYHHHIQWHLQWHRSARVVVVASPISPCTLISLPLFRCRPVSNRCTYHQLISTLDPEYRRCMRRVEIGTPELYYLYYLCIYSTLVNRCVPRCTVVCLRALVGQSSANVVPHRRVQWTVRT